MKVDLDKTEYFFTLREVKALSGIGIETISDLRDAIIDDSKLGFIRFLRIPTIGRKSLDAFCKTSTGMSLKEIEAIRLLESIGYSVKK